MFCIEVDHEAELPEEMEDKFDEVAELNEQHDGLKLRSGRITLSIDSEVSSSLVIPKLSKSEYL